MNDSIIKRIWFNASNVFIDCSTYMKSRQNHFCICIGLIIYTYNGINWSETSTSIMCDIYQNIELWTWIQLCIFNGRTFANQILEKLVIMTSSFESTRCKSYILWLFCCLFIIFLQLLFLKDWDFVPYSLHNNSS